MAIFAGVWNNSHERATRRGTRGEGFMVAGLALLALLSLDGTAVDSPAADPLASSSEIQVFLEEKIRPGLSQQQRLEALLHLVLDKKGFGFEYGPATKTAVETFQDRTGNCLSFTNLFVVMARQLGLRAHFREVAMPPTWKRDGRVVLMGAHVNVVVPVGTRNFVVDLLPELDQVTLGGRIVSDARARTHYFSNLGAEHLSVGDPAGAMEHFRVALEHDSTAGFVWVNLGVAFTMAGQLSDAEEAYEKALRLDRQDLVATSNMARLQQRLGNLEKAAEYREKAEKFQQKNPYYHFFLGEEAYLAGDFSTAAEHYRSALKLKSDDHTFHFGLARTYIHLNQPERAAGELQKALRFAPQQFEHRYSRKLELLQGDDCGSAAEVLKVP